MVPFPVLKVTSAMRSDAEQIGSKPKFWFRRDEEDWLFKEARLTTGEDWSEKVASEIAALLGLPTHQAELAIWNGKRGCAVRSFLPSKQSVLVHGNELLGGLIAGYDKQKLFGQSDHTFDNIVAVMQRLFPSPKQRREASFRMVGYLVFDALVGNTDRHHQNWGVLLKFRTGVDQVPKVEVELAPTFDHASSLGRELTDDRRERYLREQTIGRYVRKARGGIFRDAHAKHGLSPIALAQMLADRYPQLFKPWQKRVAGLPQAKLHDLFESIPDDRISPLARSFALAFLSVNQQKLVDLL
jgi:hypothetical protein